MRTAFHLFCMIGVVVSCAAADDRVWTVAKHLEVAGQKDIKKLAKAKGETYRFIEHDAGLTHSTIILLTHDESKTTASISEVSLHGYYSSKGKSGVEKKQKVLSAEEWQTISEKLTKLDFWHYKQRDKFGLDGSFWILEGAKNGVTRRIEEWSPDAGDFHALCRSIQQLEK